MTPLGNRAATIRKFAGAVASQAVVSAANFLVGLILIRGQADEQYGYYVLVVTTLLLLTGIQTGLLQPAMVIRLAKYDEGQRRDLIGGMLREQRRVLPIVALIAALVAAGLWLAGVLSWQLLALVVAADVAAMMALYREFFRMVLLGHRMSTPVLRADFAYTALLLVGVGVATFSPLPAATAVLGIALAAGVGGTMMARAMWAHEPWNIHGAPNVVREFGSMSLWSASGSAVHWAFSQGYSYLVAGMLDVAAVAAISATRLLMMPVNLLSSGVFQMMLPTAAKWFHDGEAVRVFRKLLLVALGLAGAAAFYCACIWGLRDWLFGSVLKKHFAQRDMLLALWCFAFLLMLMRDQCVYLLVTRSQFKRLSTLTAISAGIALLVSYVSIARFGGVGAILGVVVGESSNLLGILVLSMMELKRPAGELAAEQSEDPAGAALAATEAAEAERAAQSMESTA